MTALLTRGYSVHGFGDANPQKRHLVLRHDIDMSLDAAVTLARLERELCVRSTYFVLLRSGLYNPLAGRGIAQLEEILEAGHQVGLHFDASLFPLERPLLEAACRDECESLERHLGRPIEIVSFHRPAQMLIGAKGRFASRMHTYEPRFFTDMGYCADSRGKWRYGHPLDHPAVAEKRALQLLTHPIWWDSRGSEPVVGRLDRLVREHAEIFRNELAANCQPYRTALDGLAEDED